MPNSLMRASQPQQMDGDTTPEMLAQQGGMSMPQMLSQIRRFGGAFKWNAKQQVMSMVQQGIRSNQQLQQAMNMAQQITGFLGR